jgi:hypothetical protein
MHSRKLHRGDAFDRALRESLGEQITLEKIEQARLLYARYRTDDVLKRLKAVGDDSSERGQP